MNRLALLNPFGYNLRNIKKGISETFATGLGYLPKEDVKIEPYLVLVAS